VPIYEKALRLPAENYRGQRTYFVTICCEKRRVLFATESTGGWVIERLTRIAASYSFQLHAYCLMPDHLHILAEGTLESCDLVSFIHAFKQRTAFEFKEKQNSVLWQKRYYDHVLRPGESIEDVACYIWMNPVRKKLCSDARSYALSGSRTIDWMGSSHSAVKWAPPWKDAAAIHAQM
jgi:putative transposase